MNVDVIALGSCQKKIQISVPAQQVNAELDLAYRQLSKKVRLRGFRPGKAPRKVLEMRFGAQVLSDVASSLIQQGYVDAIQEHAIEPVGRPQVDPGDLRPSQDFSFSVTVDVRPEIELEAYTGLDVEYPVVEVADDEVEASVRARLEGEARLVEVADRAARSGDLVLVELTARDGDDEVVQEPGTMIRTEADPYYPGVDALVVGLATGDEKTAEVAFPDDARIEAVAGRTLAVTVKVQSIQASEVPELTDELVSGLGYEGGAAGMREALRAELAATRDEAARNQARANALQALIDANPFDVPDGMIDQQLDALVEELKLQAAYRGQDPRQVTFSQPQLADLRVRAAFAVKGGLILDYIARAESLQVTDDDLEARFREMADERGQSVEAIKGYFVRDGVVEELRARLLEEKTLDFLLERSNLVAPKDEPAAPSEPAAGADLSVLDGKVGDVKAALSSGDHDAHLQALLAAEAAGKARKGVLTAIQARLG